MRIGNYIRGALVVGWNYQNIQFDIDCLLVDEFNSPEIDGLPSRLYPPKMNQ